MAVSVGRSRLPELLARRGISQAEFSRRLGVTESFISQVIKGKKQFSYEMAKNASMILWCAMDDLHVWEETTGSER